MGVQVSDELKRDRSGRVLKAARSLDDYLDSLPGWLGMIGAWLVILGALALVALFVLYAPVGG